MALICAECDRTFTTKGALDQHLRNSPAYDCDECDQAFETAQHVRDSPAHAVTYDCDEGQSFKMQPSLQGGLLQSLRAYELAFDFFTADDPRGNLNEHDTSIMGRFTCTNRSCPTDKWTSKQIAITIRQYTKE